MGFIGLAIKNWKFVIIAALLAALAASGFYIKLLQAQKATLTSEKNALITELSVSNNSIKSLQGSIDEQNTAIRLLEESADLREKESAKEIEKARVFARNAKKRADEIIKLSKPVGVESCTAANILFDQEIENEK